MPSAMSRYFILQIRTPTALIFITLLNLGYSKKAFAIEKPQKSSQLRLYCVKKNETMSEIAKDHLGRPIYGQNSSLKNLKLLNKQITNPDLIFPDEAILTEGAISQPREGVQGEGPSTSSIECTSSQMMTKVAPAKKNFSFLEKLKIDFSGEIESYRLSTKSGSFDLASSAGPLPSIAALGCPIENLCIRIQARAFEIVGSTSLSVENEKQNLLGASLSFYFRKKNFYSLYLTSGLEEIPTFAALTTTQLSTSKTSVRFIGISSIFSFNRLDTELSILSMGAVHTPSGPASDFLTYRAKFLWDAKIFARGLFPFFEFKTSAFSTDTFNHATRIYGLGAAYNF